jgi:hypothetical protein
MAEKLREREHRNRIGTALRGWWLKLPAKVGRIVWDW